MNKEFYAFAYLFLLLGAKQTSLLLLAFILIFFSPRWFRVE